MPNKRSPLSLAVVLGLAALVPFAVGVYVAWTGTSLDARSALRWLLPYLATVVAFIGGPVFIYLILTRRNTLK